MATEITTIKNAKLQEIAKRADKNNDGKLKRNEYSLFAKEAQAQGVDYKEINEALDMNGFQRWWHDVDKISTDGNDDGKLSFKEGATSFVKGLVGGIPKAMIKHPIASALTIGAGIGLTALTGGAILPVLTAIGIATGVGMAGVGTYKAITAKTDGDAKQAFETMGMGVTTTAMSTLAAGKALKTAEIAGVKSAHIADDANILQKSVQVFKAIPESLKMSKQWAMSYIKGTPVNLEFVDGNKQTKVRGKLVNETLADGTVRNYNEKGIISEEILPDGTEKKYVSGILDEEIYKNGTYKLYNEDGTKVIEEGFIVNDKKVCYYENGAIKRERFVNGLVKDYYENGTLRMEMLPNGEYKQYGEDGTIIWEFVRKINGNEIREYTYYRGEIDKKVLKSPGYYRKKIYEHGKVVDEIERLSYSGYKRERHWSHGRFVAQILDDGEPLKKAFEPHNDGWIDYKPPVDF